MDLSQPCSNLTCICEMTQKHVLWSPTPNEIPERITIRTFYWTMWESSVVDTILPHTHGSHRNICTEYLHGTGTPLACVAQLLSPSRTLSNQESVRIMRRYEEGEASTFSIENACRCLTLNQMSNRILARNSILVSWQHLLGVVAKIIRLVCCSLGARLDCVCL